MSAAALAWQDSRPRPGYTWYALPGFDAHVYAAMAESPSFFTVAPWGYRLLTPWLVHQFRPRHRLTAFEDLTLLSLWLAGGVLFLFLRRLGNGEWPSLAAVAVFALSPPALAALRMPVMVDALALLLLLLLLVAVEHRADVALSAALLALGVLSKELTLLLPPLVFLARRHSDGALRAVLSTLLASLPAAAIVVFERVAWTPQVQPPEAAWSLATARDMAGVVASEWPDVWRRGLLGGLVPVALLGALRRRARPFLCRYGYLAAGTLAVPLVAWTNVPSLGRSPHIGDNLPRLLLFALPFLLPLALVAVDRGWPHMRPPPPAPPVPSALRGAAFAALAATLLSVFGGLDRYRREPLHETRDGPLVRALCRESLAVARRLERGEVVILDPARHSFEWDERADLAGMYRMRWYLREGWGAAPHYGTGEVATREPEAALLVPTLTPRNLEIALRLHVAQLAVVDVRLGGRALATLSLTGGREEVVLAVPAAALVRGDNRLVLRQRGEPFVPLRLEAVELRPARDGA